MRPVFGNLKRIVRVLLENFNPSNAAIIFIVIFS